MIDRVAREGIALVARCMAGFIRREGSEPERRQQALGQTKDRTLVVCGRLDDVESPQGSPNEFVWGLRRIRAQIEQALRILAEDTGMTRVNERRGRAADSFRAAANGSTMGACVTGAFSSRLL